MRLGDRLTLRRFASALCTAAILAAFGGAPSPASALSGSLPTVSPADAQEAQPVGKLRFDLAALVAGEGQLDPRIAQLVPGYRAGEIPYFAVLNVPNDATQRAALEEMGARTLRSYRSVRAFALASDATTILRVAALPSVDWLAPVELVFALEEPITDQSRATTADVGAPAQWAEGVTGQGVRIAVLDTGLDALHPDLDDLDFRRWSEPLHPPKVVEARDFNGGGCRPLTTTDGHGHGSHVAGIATGTGEGTPLADDDARYAGIAPDAELAVGKILTDAGAGLNSDLVAAMEWAAMPADPAGCAIGADIVNMSIGSEARPTRLNSDSDVDFVSLVLNRLAVRYGTLFVAAAGNSGPFVGSALEAPGSAAQALSVAATAKDYDVNHDDTLSGDSCAGWRHPPSAATNDCSAGDGNQPPSLSSFSSRGPSGDLWLRPDLAAPGYNIVSAQASTGTALAQNDLNRNTRNDPLYATATGTSMATPATAGSAALLLEAYRAAHDGADPTGASGLADLDAPTYALLRAALMNSASGDLYESRWILTTDPGTRFDCPDPDPLFGLCGIVELFADIAAGSITLYEVRNGTADPYVGPLAEGAGKLHVGGAIAALRDGIVIYSAASGSGDAAGTGHRDFQGSWQIGPTTAGAAHAQRFVVHAAPETGRLEVSFAFVPGHPSDGSLPIDAAWGVGLPGTTSVASGGDAFVDLSLTVPDSAAPGSYTGVVLATTSAGQQVRIPVFASVALHDPDPAAGNAPGPQASFTSARDVFAKGDTSWPSALGAAGTGSSADWLVFPVELAADLAEARLTVHDTDRGDETYDLYLYDSRLDLVASTHPFAAPGVTDPTANDARGPSTADAPSELMVRTPAGGRHYLVVSRAKVGGTTPGDFGSFALALDEVAGIGAAAPTALAYEGDFLFTQGSAGRLAARLTDADGAPIAGRVVRFTVDDPTVAPCPGGTCVAVTDYRGLAQVATDPIALAPGIHEVRAAFDGDRHWMPSAVTAFVLVVGAGVVVPGGGQVTAGGWFVPDGVTAGRGDAGRVHFAFHAMSGAGAPGGELRWRDSSAGVELTLVRHTALVVEGDTATLAGTVRDGTGTEHSFVLTAQDAGEPGRGTDRVELRLLDASYATGGTLGGGNVQLHR